MKNLNLLQKLIKDVDNIKDLKVTQITDDFGNERFVLTCGEYWSKIFNQTLCIHEWYFVVKNNKVGHMAISKKPSADGKGNIIPAEWSFKETYPSIKEGFNAFIDSVNA